MILDRPGYPLYLETAHRGLCVCASELDRRKSKQKGQSIPHSVCAVHNASVPPPGQAAAAARNCRCHPFFLPSSFFLRHSFIRRPPQMQVLPRATSCLSIQLSESCICRYAFHAKY